jgi:thioredoxin-dependent peroxiredoxin
MLNLSPKPLGMTKLKAGDKAPDFSTIDDQGNKVSLKDLRGKKVVLYFYPKDNTSGCTKQACELRDNYAKFKKLDAVILGVSPDSQKSHTKFISKFDLPFPLLVDEDKKIIEAYDVWHEKSMYGLKFMGVVRTTFIIDEKGKITHVFPKVKVPEHLEQVIKALKE